MTTTEQYAVCEECGLTCYTGAEHYKAIQNGEEWRCADCDSDYEDRDDTEDDSDQDNFTNRVCGYYPECGKDFDLADPHYYDEDEGECYCCEECFKKEQNRFAEQDRCEDAPECGCCWDDAIDANAELNAAIDASGNCF